MTELRRRTSLKNQTLGRQPPEKLLRFPTKDALHMCLTLIRIAIKKCVAVRLGVICDCQATNRNKGRLPMRAPPRRTPISHLTMAIYDSQPSRIHKNITTDRWKLLLLIEKSNETGFFYIKSCNKI